MDRSAGQNLFVGQDWLRDQTSTMITGYNTDVRYGDLVLHVQTEDKGQTNPCIESLIYCGGQVVVAKRASYADLIKLGKGKTEVTALMDHQHRTMIKAIQTGKFDGKIREYMPDAKLSKPSQEGTSPGFPAIVEGGQSLDQVILEYLTSEAEQEQLVLVLEQQAELRAGGRLSLALRTRSSKSGQPVAGVVVNVKMISTLGGPNNLADGRTDHDGLVQLPIDIPAVDHGTAALIITANSSLGQAELKHLL